MRYLFCPGGNTPPYYDYKIRDKNIFLQNERLIVFDLATKKYTNDGKTWHNILRPENHL